MQPGSGFKGVILEADISSPSNAGIKNACTVPVYSSASEAVCRDILINHEHLLGVSREN